MTIAISTTVLRHRVRLLHASTAAPLGPLRARLLSTPHGWMVRPVTDGVIVTARQGVPHPDTPPQLAVTLVPPFWRDLLVFPPLPVQPPRTVVVGLVADEIDVSLHPVPMTLTVGLTTPATGAPRTGRTVVARATGGPDPKPTIALPETGPGIYTSASAEWTARFMPCDVLVDGDALRTVAMDLTSTVTRIRLVDTT